MDSTDRSLCFLPSYDYIIKTFIERMDGNGNTQMSIVRGRAVCRASINTPDQKLCPVSKQPHGIINSDVTLEERRCSDRISTRPRKNIGNQSDSLQESKRQKTQDIRPVLEMSGASSNSSNTGAEWPPAEPLFQPEATKDVKIKDAIKEVGVRQDTILSIVKALVVCWRKKRLREKLMEVFISDLEERNSINSCSDFIRHIQNSGMTLWQFTEKCRSDSAHFYTLFNAATGAADSELTNKFENVSIHEFEDKCNSENKYTDLLCRFERSTFTGEWGITKFVRFIATRFNISVEADDRNNLLLMPMFSELSSRGVTIGSLMEAIKSFNKSGMLNQIVVNDKSFREFDIGLRDLYQNKRLERFLILKISPGLTELDHQELCKLMPWVSHWPSRNTFEYKDAPASIFFQSKDSMMRMSFSYMFKEIVSEEISLLFSMLFPEINMKHRKDWDLVDLWFLDFITSDPNKRLTISQLSKIFRSVNNVNFGDINTMVRKLRDGFNSDQLRVLGLMEGILDKSIIELCNDECFCAMLLDVVIFLLENEFGWLVLYCCVFDSEDSHSALELVQSFSWRRNDTKGMAKQMMKKMWENKKPVRFLFEMIGYLNMNHCLNDIAHWADENKERIRYFKPIECLPPELRDLRKKTYLEKLG
nr:hypothetical protein [Endozoicomonas sp.]